jgi:alkanesulfonate monooxygenase SsuD/methylene tetrahydromethanopterin reductase-like flavin-dependent oxidoreductase (luciferase family)
MKLGLIPSIGEGGMGSGKTVRFSELKDIAQMAEAMGFDSLWLDDHLIFRFPDQDEGGCWECFTFLSGLAAVTSRMQLGPLVACTSFRNPALLAKMTASLDEISQGRFILGLGAGWHEPEYLAYGYPFDHLASRFEEALQIIVPLLKEGHVDFAGNYYQARNCVLRPRGPSAGRIPIMIGSSQPRMLEITARYADMWNRTAWRAKADRIAGEYPKLLQACKTVGRDPASIELTAGVEVHFLAPGQARDPNDKGITGNAEEIAQELRAFADVGVQHLIIAVEPQGMDGLKQFARVIELLDSTPSGQ